MWSTVDVWHGGEVTALGVPVAAGRFVEQRDQDVPERLNVTLPAEWEGKSLDPATKRAVLGADGHELAVTVHLASMGQPAWKVRLPRVLVQSGQRAKAGIEVKGHGLLQVVQDDHRAAPRSPGSISPIAGELMRELADVGFQTRVHPSLPSLSIPKDFVFGEDRLKSVLELVTAWPARMRVDPDGVVEFLPPLTTDLGQPVVHFHDGEGGTIVGAPSEFSREGVYNRVIVKVQPEGDAPMWTHTEEIRTGRLDVRKFRVRSRTVESNAIRYVAQAQSIGWQELAASQVRARTLPVEAAADWRLELDDTVRVTTSEGVDETGRVTGVDMPLTSSDGVARYNVGVVD